MLFSRYAGCVSKVSILGIPIDPLTRREAVLRIRAMLHTTSQHHVVTPNNEMLVESSRNPEFRQVLQEAELAIADSTGLLWAARFTGQHLPERVTGVDTVTDLCHELTEEEPVFFLGAGEGIAGRAAAALKDRNPHLTVAGAFAGTPREEDASDIIRLIHASGARLLLVAYGAPAQDLWIHRHLREIPAVRVAMGVGGTFDFLAGAKKRAPVIVRKLYLEWAWRLLIEPQRLPRILTATVVFPWLVVTRRFRAIVP